MINESVERLHVGSMETGCAVTVVVPVLNEEDVLPAFHRRLVAALASTEGGWEVEGGRE